MSPNLFYSVCSLIPLLLKLYEIKKKLSRQVWITIGKNLIPDIIEAN